MCKPTEARDQLSKPLLRYRCIAKKSATLRAGRELSSAKRELEILHGWTVDVADVVENGAGVLRCRVVSYSTPWTPPGASAQAADGWVSAKLFAYDGQSAHPNPARAEVEEAVEEKKPAKEKTGFAAVFDAPTGEGHALLFPGQGAQKVGMLEPYKSAPGVKAMFKKASKIFGTDLLELVEKGVLRRLEIYGEREGGARAARAAATRFALPRRASPRFARCHDTPGTYATKRAAPSQAPRRS